MQLDDLEWILARNREHSWSRVWGMILYRSKQHEYAFLTGNALSYPLLCKFNVANKWLDQLSMECVLVEMEKHALAMQAPPKYRTMLKTDA